MRCEKDQGYTIGQDAIFYLGRSRWYYFFYGFSALAFSFYISALPLQPELAILAWFVAAALFIGCLAESRCSPQMLRYSACGEWSLKQGSSIWQAVEHIFIKRVTPLGLQLVIVTDVAEPSLLATLFPNCSPKKRLFLWRDQLPDNEWRLLRVLLSLG